MSQKQEIKARKQGMSYTSREKTIILNVFKYFHQEDPELCITKLVKKTSKATGCSEKSIFQFRKEEQSVEGLKEPSKTKIRKGININSRDLKYNDNVRQAIRDVINGMKYNNIEPSMSMILNRVNANDQLPNFSLMTLRRLIFEMGYCYEKNSNGKPILIEKTNKKEKSLKNHKKNQNDDHTKNKIETKNNTVNDNMRNNVHIMPQSMGVQNLQNGENIQMNQLQHNMDHTQSNLMHTHVRQDNYPITPLIAPPILQSQSQMHNNHNMPLTNHRNGLLPSYQGHAPNINMWDG